MCRFFVCFLVAGVFSVGCGKSGPAVAEVKGVVTLDGKSMTEGEISFVPSGGGIPSVLEIKNGAFEGNASEGKNRVEIRAYRKGTPVKMGDETFGGESENFIPATYNLESTMTANVTATGPNDFKFTVTSKVAE